MFFIISKTLYFLIQPINWVLGTLCYSVFTKNEIRKKRAAIFALIFGLFFTNHFIYNQAIQLWEYDTMHMDDIKEPYDLAIVLGGYSNFHIRPADDRHNFNARANRFTQALELYKKGKVKKLLFTGGSGDILNQNSSEALEIVKFLETMGIPREDYILEPDSRNTRENALFSKKIIDEKFPDARCLLVTSAWHMRRSIGLFKKVNVDFTPFSVDHIGEKTRFVPMSMIVPDRLGFYRWEILIKEIVGYTVYWLKGYL